MSEGFTDYKKSLTILKRIDPHTIDILARVEKVSLYAFCSTKNEWEDNGIEGEFYICNRDVEPFSSLHILNIKKKNNLSEFIYDDWDWKMDEPMLLYRKGDIIFGVEFYTLEDYTKITTLVTNIMDSVKQKQDPNSKQKLSGTKIVSLLNQAQQDFQKVTTMIGNQSSESQPSTSKITMNLAEDDASSLPPSADATTALKKEVNIEEIEALTSALSLMEKSGKPVHIIPEMCENKTKNGEELSFPGAEKPEPLDCEEMQQALMHLIKNDADFLKKLHETYIKSYLNLI